MLKYIFISLYLIETVYMLNRNNTYIIRKTINIILILFVISNGLILYFEPNGVEIIKECTSQIEIRNNEYIHKLSKLL